MRVIWSARTRVTTRPPKVKCSRNGWRRYVCKTWIHSMFEGILTNETRCLACDTVTSRHESFLDLSLEIEQNSSVADCMQVGTRLAFSYDILWTRSFDRAIVISRASELFGDRVHAS